MKLYTSIDVAKLAAFNDVREDDLGSLLLTYKHKTRQVQCTTTASTGTAVDPADPDPAAESDATTATTATSTTAGPAGGELGNDALDVHYYVTGGMVHVDEAERERRFEGYFLGQLEQNAEIGRDAEDIDTVV